MKLYTFSLFIILAASFPFETHAQYAGTWKGKVTPIVDSCGLDAKEVNVMYRVRQSGRRLTVRVSGISGRKSGSAYRNSFSFSSGDYDRVNDILCLRRYLWQFNKLSRNKADHIYVSTYGCSDGESCVAAWRGTVTR